MATTAFPAASKTQKKEISLLIAKARETRAAEIAPLRKRLKRRNFRARKNPQIENLKITASNNRYLSQLYEAVGCGGNQWRTEEDSNPRPPDS